MSHASSNHLLLLGLLRERSMHGYELADVIERALPSCTELRKSTTYFLLERMAQEGWVTCTSAQEGNRPPRRVYHVSASGEEAFQRLLRENVASDAQPAWDGDIGLAFLDTLKPAEARELLLRRRSALADRAGDADRAPAHPGSMQLVVEHQRHHLQSELEWIDHVLAGLDRRASKTRASHIH